MRGRGAGEERATHKRIAARCVSPVSRPFVSSASFSKPDSSTCNFVYYRRITPLNRDECVRRRLLRCSNIHPLDMWFGCAVTCQKHSSAACKPRVCRIRHQNENQTWRPVHYRLPVTDKIPQLKSVSKYAAGTAADAADAGRGVLRSTISLRHRVLCTPPSAFPFQRHRQQTSCLLFRFLSPVYPNVLHLLVRCLHLRDKQAPAHSAGSLVRQLRRDGETAHALACLACLQFCCGLRYFCVTRCCADCCVLCVRCGGRADAVSVVEDG